MEFTQGTTVETSKQTNKTQKWIHKTKIRQPVFKPAHSNPVTDTGVSKRWRRQGTGRPASGLWNVQPRGSDRVGKEKLSKRNEWWVDFPTKMISFLSVIPEEPLEMGKEMPADLFLGSSIPLTSSYLGMCCLRKWVLCYCGFTHGGVLEELTQNMDSKPHSETKS